MSMHDPYVAVDDVLMPWASLHGIKVGTLDRDVIVRSIWVFDRSGNQRAQLWLDTPSVLNVVTVHVAELRLDLPAKWGEKFQRTAKLSELAATLDEFIALAFKWAGEGAFA